MVLAVAGPAVLADDSMRLDEQDPAVVCVGYRERAVGEHVRVIGGMEVGAISPQLAGMPEQDA